MRTRSLLTLGAALVAIVVSIVLLRPKEPTRTGFIYLLDTGVDSSKPWSPAPDVIKTLEEDYMAQVVSRATASIAIRTDKQAMLEEFGKARGALTKLPTFFALTRPYSRTKKELRAAIDKLPLQQESRERLLEQLIVVRDTEKLSNEDECEQLKDDIAYAMRSFLGIGLLVNDATVVELAKCLTPLPAAK
jgi:hypothetical protein